MNSKEHILEIDGVRGIAILLVVAYHAFLFTAAAPTGWAAKVASYGFAGVDLFFVLSGFLITRILLNAKTKAGYFANFYARRALRIWPLYYGLLVVVFGALPILAKALRLPVGELSAITDRNPVVYVLLLQNVWYPVPGPTVLAMTWSLAIEEQFYLVWPWLVLFCDRTRLAFASIAVLGLSPAFRYWAISHGTSFSAVYFSTWFRLDGLAAGALIALYWTSPFAASRRTAFASLFALLGLPLAVWLIETHSRLIGTFQFSLLAVSAGGVVLFALWSSQAQARIGSLLRAKSVRFFGQVSYCLYLVHQPIYYVLSGRVGKRLFPTGTTSAVLLMILGFAVSTIVASLSWYLFEVKILQWGKDRKRVEGVPMLPAVDVAA